MMPSMRVMVRWRIIHPKSQKRRAAPVITSRSRLPIEPSGRGRITADRPSTKNMLNRQLPITLPTARPGRPFVAATTEVASSGRDVPAATMVRPITASLTPMARASDDALSTKISPPHTRAARPSTIMPQAFHIGTGTSNCEVSCRGSGSE